MTKVLNLDSLLSTEKTFVLDGKNYKVGDMTVEAYIEYTAAAKELENIGSGDVETSINRAIRILIKLIPALTVERLRKFTPVQLNKLVEFALMPAEDIANEVEGAKGNE